MPTAAPEKLSAPIKANIADWPFEFEVVPLKYLKIDEYQRPLTSFVEKIQREFNPALINTLCLSKRSATHYAVIDGQTRAEGMRRLGMKTAPAVVFYDLTPPQEAELFALFQTERRGMTSASRYRAQVFAKNPTALAINEVLEGLGFSIDHNNTAPGAIRAVAAVEYVYRGCKKSSKRNDGDPELLAKVLETLRAAWPKLPDTAKSAPMIRGIGYYLTDPKNDNVDLERLGARLSKVQPSDLAKRAEHIREGRAMSGNSPRWMAEAIEAQYRKAR